jgi:PAS domain S-box-containing protein
LSSLRILVVDDHEPVRRGLRSLLSSRTDWSICGEAVDGIEAVEKAKTLRPNVVLMDISMPRMNGLDATRINRREVAGSEVVIVSEDEGAVLHRQALEVEASAYVKKSSLSQDLLPTIDRVLRKRKSQDSRNLLPVEFSPTLGESYLPVRSGVGSGEMADLIRARNWSETPIGAPEKWSPSLRMMVDFVLANRFPILLWWGPQYVQIYNDAYRPILGEKHPRALGQPTRECWHEVWDILRPLIDTPFQGGSATWMEDFELELERSSFVEEAHFTVAYSPVPDETAPRGIGGVIATVCEITEKIISARRVAILRDLSARTMEMKTAEEACNAAAEVLANDSKDVPFALLYLIDSDRKNARLAGVAGIPGGKSISAPTVKLVEDGAENRFGFSLLEVLRTEQMVVIDGLDRCFGEVPRGPWSTPPRSAVLLPIRSNKAHDLAGVLVAGVSSRLTLDHLYISFFELIATQIATAVANTRAYEEERKRVEALAAIDRAKTAFFSNVSHEFRTPLTLMLGPLEDLLANSHLDLPQAAKTELEMVSRNGSRLLRLVNTLLDFSRIEAGRMQAVYEPTDLSIFTLELASVFRSATEKAGLRLELDCPRDAKLVFVDRSMWEKIVLNLISNAFKFTFEGEIAVEMVYGANTAELRVRDTGAGIPENELPRLFDRFHRVQNTRSRTDEGSGIGLALVQELVKLHGGSVRVESRLGKGSTFSVTVPLGNAHLAPGRIGGTRSFASTAVGARSFVEEALRWLPDAGRSETADELLPSFDLGPIPHTSVSRNDASSFARPRVLIADDNADMRQYLVRLLAERYDVQAVPDGLAALDAVRKRSPELILTDVMMPQLDGFGLLRQLRSDAKMRAIPIILLSARAGEESRVEGLEHGADDYLIKPFSARELLARVHTHLELARVRKESEDALRERTAQFETLLNNAPLGVYLLDSDLRIQQVNPTALPAFGSIPDVIGRDFAEIIHSRWPKPYADDIVQRFRYTLETGEPFVVPEWTAECRDRGVREWYEWQINRIPLPNGRLGVVCYFRDISSQIETREVLRESEERLRTLAGGLETQVRIRTEEIERRNAEVLQQAEQLRELSNCLLQSQDDERRRLARELHDSAGQIVTALGMYIGSMIPHARQNPPLGKAVEESRELVRQLSKEMRTMSYLLHPPLLDENGLSEAIRWYVQGLTERSGLTIELSISEEFSRLPNELELAVFRIVQECLTNIHRHSGSKTATIQLSLQAESISLQIQDKGKGISAEKLAEIQSQRSGVGITGMRERVRHFRGVLDIQSNGRGTKIAITLPIPLKATSAPEGMFQPTRAAR